MNGKKEKWAVDIGESLSWLDIRKTNKGRLATQVTGRNKNLFIKHHKA